MVIEWLKFRVAPELQENFLKKDEAIWTSLLASYPGFLGKETWLVPDAAEEIVFVIRWQTRQQWKSIPIEVLAETEQKFAQQVGKNNYEMIEMKEYQVRKFPEMSR